MKTSGWLALAGLAITLTLGGCSATSKTYANAQNAGWNHYGESAQAKGQDVALGALSGNEKNVVTTGTIEEVCPMKGCWMTLVDENGDELTVRFKDYSFFVPKNAAGRRVVVHGWTEKKLLSVDELRHYAEDAGKSPEEIAKITEPAEQVVFMADSVYIEGDGLEAPHTQ